MVETGRELSALAGELVTYPQVLVNVRVQARSTALDSVPADQGGRPTRSRRGSTARGRLLVRYSGTEPLLRIMIEGKDQQRDPALGRRDRGRRADASRAEPTAAAAAMVRSCSVNVNKVATLRNSRGGRVPSVLDAVRTIVEAGAPGITVHPRADARHITQPGRARRRRGAGAAARVGSSSTSRATPRPT